MKKLLLLPATGVVLASLGFLSKTGLPQDSGGSSRGISYYTFRLENTTGHEVHVRVIENGEAIIDVFAPRSLREINEPAGSTDSNPVSVLHVTVPLHDSTPTLEVEETSLLNVHKSFPIAGFAERPDLDFRISVSKQGVSLTQDYRMPDALTNDERRMPERERAARRALDRKGDPQATFFLLNHSGKPVHLRGLLDGTLLFDVAIPAARPSSEARRVHDPGCPYEVRTVPLNPQAKVLEIDETQSLKSQRSFRLKDFDPSRGADFRVSVTSKAIEVTRGTFAY